MLWEQPEGTGAAASRAGAPQARQTNGGGFGPELPPSVITVRFVFDADDGPDCCVAVDPDAVPIDPASGQRLLVLTDLPSGSATLSVAGFPVDFAPTVDGITRTCTTRPAAAGRACDLDRIQTPSFLSAPQPVTIVPGAQTDAGDILVSSVPFVIAGSLTPAPGAEAANPVGIRCTVVDAASGIDPASIALMVTQDGAPDGDAAPTFDACDDATSNPCSAGGALHVTGFEVARAAEVLDAGPAHVRIGARNGAGRSLDFAYEFSVRQAATTPTPTVEAPTEISTGIPTATATSPRPTASAFPTSTVLNPTRTPSPTGTPPQTPTATATWTPPFVGLTFVGADPVPVTRRAEYLVPADLNRDGAADLVVVSPQNHNVQVLLGSTSSPSRFDPLAPFDLGEEPKGAAVGNLNGDGIPDLAVADPGKGVWILLGAGNGTFTGLSRIFVGESPTALAIADFDGVRGNDLAIADRRAGSVLLRLNDGNASPRFLSGPRPFAGDEPTVVVAVDFNGDRKPDLATLNVGGPRLKSVGVLVQRVGDGPLAFDSVRTVSIGENADSLLVADFDGDGNDDLAVLSHPADAGNSEVRIALNTGTGGLRTPFGFDVPCPVGGALGCRARAMTAADFDGNGTADLAVALPLGGGQGDGVQVFSGLGEGQFRPGVVFTVGKSPITLAADDFNGDGMADLAVATDEVDAIQAFINVSALGEKEDGELCLVGEECRSRRCTNGRCCAAGCQAGERCDVPGQEGTCVAVARAAGQSTGANDTCPSTTGDAVP